MQLWCKACTLKRHKSLNYSVDPDLEENTCSTCGKSKSPDEFYKNKTWDNGNIDNIIGLEVPMYSDILRVAGTTDCIADYNGK